MLITAGLFRGRERDIGHFTQNCLAEVFCPIGIIDNSHGDIVEATLSWICRDWAATVIQRTPRKRFESSEATCMISSELNSADFGFARIWSTALPSVFCSSIPKTVALS